MPTISLNRQINLDGKPRKKGFWLVIGVLVFLIALGAVFAKIGFWSSVSFVADIVAPTQLKQTDGRVNALILGLDTRPAGNAAGGSLNTDTILIGSISATGGDPALISVPRDFWANLAPYGWGKINSAYYYGGTQKDGSFDEAKGVEFAKAKIEEILGIPIHYYAVIDFASFKEVIDTLGGVNICVEQAFDDYLYPVEGKENAPIISQRYEHLHFNAGCQLMDGETALKYSRSREGTNGEGNDFARARRQQKVILAVKDKLSSLNLLTDSGKIVELYQQFSKSIKTDLTFNELRRILEISQKFAKFPETKNLVLDPDSQLVYHPNPDLYGGAYVVVPTGGDYEKIHTAVSKFLFGEAGNAGSK